MFITFGRQTTILREGKAKPLRDGFWETRAGVEDFRRHNGHHTEIVHVAGIYISNMNFVSIYSEYSTLRRTVSSSWRAKQTNIFGHRNGLWFSRNKQGIHVCCSFLEAPDEMTIGWLSWGIYVSTSEMENPLNARLSPRKHLSSRHSILSPLR